ncbi:hypothetical protein U2F10_03030 [Leptothoe sp. EHU-05/26/07-4]
MQKLLPFVNKPLEEIEVVGSERTGQLHLVSLKGVTPNENPADFQEQQKKQQKFLLRLSQRIKQLAKEQSVPIKEMRKKVMGAMGPNSDPLAAYGVFVCAYDEYNALEFSTEPGIIYFLKIADSWVIRVHPDNGSSWKTYPVHQNLNLPAYIAIQEYLNEQFNKLSQWPVTQNLSSDQINKLKFLVNRLQLDILTQESDENELFDYLDEQTAELLFNLQEDKARVEIRAATFMLKYRVVYPVVALSNSVAGSRRINIQPPQAPIEKNVSVRFGPHQYAETTELLVPGLNQTDTLHVDELPFEIKDGDVGFICQPGSRNLKIGFPDWSEEDTRDSIPEELIALLFQFYQKEAGIVADLDTDDAEDSTGTPEDEGNLLSPSNEPSQTLPSIGETSTTDSSGLESETSDSTTKILETSQVG